MASNDPASGRGTTEDLGWRAAVVVAGILFLFSMGAMGQMQDLKFVAYRTKDGLTDNVVTKTVTDSKGFLWIATKNGLSRYDGMSFKNYSSMPGDAGSLRSIWVTDLLKDNNGLLWVTTEGGICYYDERYDRFNYINKEKEITILYKGPICNGDGNVAWSATEDGLLRIDTRLKTYARTALTRIPDPQCIARARDGSIWVGTRGYGVFRYDVVRGTVRHLFFPSLTSAAHIMDLLPEGDSVLWAATSEGLLKITNDSTARLFSTGEGELAGQHIDELMCLAFFDPLTEGKGLVCGTYNRKLLFFDRQAKRFIHQWRSDGNNGMQEAVFHSLYEHDRILWISTDHGLCELNLDGQDRISVVIPTLEENGHKTLVKRIVTDHRNNNIVWMCLSPPLGGVLQYDMASRKIIASYFSGVHTSEKDIRIYNSIHQDSHGAIWAAAANRLDRFGPCVSSPHSLSGSYPIPSVPLCMDIDQGGDIWMGTDSGILFFNTALGVYTAYNHVFQGTPVENSSFQQPFPVNDIICDRQGMVWLASIKYGLFSFDRVTKQFTAHRQPFSGYYEVKNRCDAVALDSGENVWVGHMGGLASYDRHTGAFVNYDRSKGLHSSYVFSLTIDANGNICGRGNTGIFTFNSSRKTFTNAVLPEETNGAFYDQRISANKSNILVGAEGGFSMFRNEYSSDPCRTLNTYISSCLVMNQKYFFDQDSARSVNPSFPWHQNVFQFHFAAPDFSAQGDPLFAYQLQGFDKEMRTTDQLFSPVYSNLPPGSYTFRVRALKNDRPGNAYASFAFVIHSPVWKTWWFITFSAVTVLLILYLLYRYRLRQLEKFYGVRYAISRDLHDEIGATLSSIAIYSEVGKSKSAGEASYFLEKINSASSNLMESMNDIVWYVNPRNDSMESVVVKMREYAAPVLEAKGVVLHFNVDRGMVTHRLTMEQRQHIYRIFKEAVNNIAKYSEARNVWVDMTVSDRTIGIAVRDDGKGFDWQTVKRGNGLVNIQQRVMALRGQFQLESSPGKGTIIRVSIHA